MAKIDNFWWTLVITIVFKSRTKKNLLKVSNMQFKKIHFFLAVSLSSKLTGTMPLHSSVFDTGCFIKARLITSISRPKWSIMVDTIEGGASKSTKKYLQWETHTHNKTKYLYYNCNSSSCSVGLLKWKVLFFP